jgi:hypothetical protein
MFAGLGAAERRTLLILRPGRPLTVSQAHDALPEYDFRVHRQAMQSLCRKGFVQTVPGPVFAISTRLSSPARQTPKRAKRFYSEARAGARAGLSRPFGQEAVEQRARPGTAARGGRGSGGAGESRRGSGGPETAACGARETIRCPGNRI